MSESVQGIVKSLTEMDIPMDEYDDHYKLYTNNVRQFEIDILQDALTDEGYTAWRFDNDGVRFLKVLKDEP